MSNKKALKTVILDSQYIILAFEFIKLFLVDSNSTWIPDYRTEKYRLQKAYARFFPIFSDEDRRKLEPLKSLNEFKPPLIYIAKEDLASVSSFLIDR